MTTTVHTNTISVEALIQKESLENLTEEIDTKQRLVTTPALNRPALQLAGFFDYYHSDRIQIIGKAEAEYIKTLPAETARERYRRLTASGDTPCLIYSRNLTPDMGMITACRANQTPLLRSPKNTGDLEAELSRWLRVKMAPMETVHGVMVDVYGEGLLIIGQSGVGKSEIALELVRRGHRLVADDAVDLYKVSDATLVGTANEMTRHLLELRGVGVVDMMDMFGVESVKDTQSLDMVIQLEEWDDAVERDRLGLKEEYTAFLGNRVPCHRIPIRPGRNLAVIVEAAAVNSRAKKLGYNAPQKLYDRISEKLGKETPVLTTAPFDLPEDVARLLAEATTLNKK